MHSLRTNNKGFLRSQSLTRRRRKRKIIRLWVLFFCFCLILALIAWIVSLPSMAIKKVVVVGNANVTSEEIQRISEDILNSKYIGLFSKRNALLYPRQRIEDVLIKTYPRILAVAIDTESFEILNIKVKEREAVAVWCAAIDCHLVDEDGYIFAIYNEIQKNNDAIVGSSTQVSVVDYEKLPKLYGGDQFVGPEPIGKSIFNKKLYLDLQNTIVELQKSGLGVTSVHVYSRDEIVFVVSNGGKLIFSDRKPFEVSLNDLKASLKSSVFSGTTSPGVSVSTSSSTGFSKINLPAHFEYIDVRFGNKVFYKIDKKDTDLKASSTLKSNI